MSPANLLFFLAWIGISTITARCLKRRSVFFTSLKGVLTIFTAALICAVLHNLVSAHLGVEELVFFLITFFAFGVSLALLLVR